MNTQYPCTSADAPTRKVRANHLMPRGLENAFDAYLPGAREDLLRAVIEYAELPQGA